ncbi:MAG: nicotinamide-nucleotide adenylyltransferase [Promethearchaeota archaeon]|nr:MAG: nicotinamide-nucleotide adenylyltransferase [Candidatus Lokiarchaeota archaeon]
MRKMEKEILACIKREHFKYLQSGQISKYIFPMERKKAHKEGIPHLIVRIFLIAQSPSNDIFFLVQRRGENKKAYPGYFTDTASGHIIYNENLDLECIKKNAFRELEEEFGINENDVKKLHFYDFKIEKDQFTPEIAYLFIGNIDYDTKFKPNPNELMIKESKFYSRSQLRDIVENEKAVDYSKEIWMELLNSDLQSYLNGHKDDMKSKAKTALFIGRFQPFHLGHLYVILEIFKQCEYLKIAIGSSQIDHTYDNPFTKNERKKFIERTLISEGIDKNVFTTYYIPDIFNANKWVNHVVSIVGDFDIVYGSDWVRELFNKKGYEVVDKIRIYKDKYKYGGENIRDLISKGNNEWKTLVPQEVITFMKEFNGIERIQKLYQNEEENEFKRDFKD